MTGRVVEVVDVTPRHAEHDNLLLDSSLPGVPDVQVARISAASGTQQATFAIVFSAFASESQRRAVLKEARDHLKDGPTGLVLSNDAGRIDLDVGDASATLAFLMAGASAVLQYSWAWDESESIVVSAGTESFQFTVQFNGNHTFNATELAAA
jgi:hypothetical protein